MTNSNKTKAINRRDFFKTSVCSSTALFLVPGIMSNQAVLKQSPQKLNLRKSKVIKEKSSWYLDLSPAKWIWYPAERTLTNSFFLFRKEFNIPKKIKSATGWILGESRYIFYCNGKRIQFGPAPADPRYTEADPIDLTQALQQGNNVLGAQIMYYGHGDGTLPMGKYGFLFSMKLTYEDDSTTLILSDQSWETFFARSWKPGQYKRWYLRALQEEFDARLFPNGWNLKDFEVTGDWQTPKITGVLADKPALASKANDYLFNAGGSANDMELRKRMLPMPVENEVAPSSLLEVQAIKWNRSPQEYFELMTENAYENGTDKPVLNVHDNGIYEVQHSNASEGILLTYEFSEQIVGFPFVQFTVPEGTIVELMTQEGHVAYKDGGELLMNNHFNAWSRITCKNGENYFEPFEYESLRFLQLHIHGHKGEKIKIEKVGVRRRLYPWKHKPLIKVDNPKIQQIFDACINTVYNNSIETMVDGMGRERQQYSGDIGHQVHVIHPVFDAPEFFRRYMVTYSQGLTKDGFFLDTWPAYDRMNRLAQRQLDLTPWGPLVDHGIGFNFDCYYHYLYCGKLDDFEEVFPRLVRFFYYLEALASEDGLLPVENLGVPTVWMDTDAYQQQRHKQCAFNLYAIAMLKHAFMPLCKAKNETELIKSAEKLADLLLKNTISKFWDTETKCFISNLPWHKEEEEKLMDERSLATACLFDLAPDNQISAMEEVLNTVPDTLGRCYPPNANWGLWALGKSGNLSAVLEDFTSRWFNLQSVQQNNTMQEAWKVKPDSGSQWSHAAVAPLYVTYMYIAGILPTNPAFETYQIFPRPDSLTYIELDYYTVKGKLYFKLEGKAGKRKLTVETLSSGNGVIVLPENEKVRLTETNEPSIKGFKKYILPKGEKVELKLKYI